MKLRPLLAVALLSASPMAFAGHEMVDSKDSKQTVVDEPLFKDHELQFGDYAIYSVGNGPAHAGLFRNHAWGSGSEINYFFTRYLGIGAEYHTVYAQESPDTDNGRLHNHQVARDHVGGNLFFRVPIESLHLAPYVFVGGGAEFGDRTWGSAHAGLGFEYRIIQHFLPSFVAERVGFFADARWTYLGDRYFPDDNQSRGDLNFFSARSGFRFTF
ncbi:MAG: hypothetical protein ABJF10_03195 [Chthoniobacter sp.]|uniref:hypothetical protein n=1 Tax=Chthoniobacter sp. TaxID=2510640 RepID=UPI0032A40BC0